MKNDVYTIPKYMIKAARQLNDNDRLKCYDAMFNYLDDGEIPNDGIALSFMALAQEALEREKRKLNTVLGRRCGEYSEWRKRVFERDGYICQNCGKRGGTLNAHHILPYSRYPELRYDLDNGITLCKACHTGVHYGEIKLNT